MPKWCVTTQHRAHAITLPTIIFALILPECVMRTNNIIPHLLTFWKGVIPPESNETPSPQDSLDTISALRYHPQ